MAVTIIEELRERFPDAGIIGELPELSERNRKAADIQAGESGCLKDFLQEVIEEDAEPEDVEKAKELLQRLEEYRPLAKVEELEEANYNMIDNVLNNEKPKKIEQIEGGRVSIKEKLAEKRAELSWSDKQAAKEKEPKEPEKKPERSGGRFAKHTAIP